jgi:hypothetical protein
VILWSHILFLACLVYLINFIRKMISDTFSTCKQPTNSTFHFSKILLNCNGDARGFVVRIRHCHSH